MNRPAAVLLALWTAATGAAQHSAEEIDAGARLYRANCASCHGPEGDAVPGVELARGKFRRAATDADLYRIISEGIPGTAMTATSLSLTQVMAVVAYLRSLAAAPKAPVRGDAARGRALFMGKGGCTACHRVHGAGSRLGPDLSDIGALRTVAYLEASLLRPNESVLPQHRFVRAVTREGTVITGRRLNEDTHTVQLLDSQEQLRSLAKSGLQEFEILKTSPMPSVEGKLSRRELDDLLSYLASLKGLD